MTSGSHFLAVHLHKQSLQTDEQSEPQGFKSGENHSHQFGDRAERIFVRFGDLTAFGIVSAANCEATTRIIPSDTLGLSE